jgi:hypothetical protein
MVRRWTVLFDVLERTGYWTDAQAVEAVHLQGFSVRQDRLRFTPEAWVTLAYAAVCRPGDPDKNVAPLCAPHLLPDDFARPDAEVGIPERPDCRAALLAMVEKEIEILSTEGRRLAKYIDRPAREAIIGAACIPFDSPQTRLYLRYQAESRLLFHRSFECLTKTLRQDAERPAPEVDEADQPSEAAAESSPEVSEPGLVPSPLSPGVQVVPGGRRIVPERSRLENDSPIESHVEVVSGVEGVAAWQAVPPQAMT